MNLPKKARLIEFPKICDSRGNLSFVEGGRHVPFSIRRVFYIYDVPGGETRGGHAHRECAEVIMAGSGSFDLIITNGEQESRVTLNRSNMAAYIPPGAGTTRPNFPTGTVLLALTSHEYEESDYIRDYDEYLRYAASLPEESRADVNF